MVIVVTLKRYWPGSAIRKIPQVHLRRIELRDGDVLRPHDVGQPGDDEREREDRARERRGIEDVDEAPVPLPADQLGGEPDRNEEKLEVETGPHWPSTP